MRRGIILLLVLFLIGALSGVNAQELTVSDIEFIDEGYNHEHPLIILTKEGSALNVQLMNYSAHPYTEEFVITPEMSGGSDGEPCSVSIGVSYINHSIAAIITMFNVSFNVHGIEANSFYFSCWWYKGMVSLTEGEPLELWENRNISKDGVTYTLDNKTKTATLSSGRHVEGEYNIPSELDYGGQAFTLTSINYPAFAFNTSLTSVIIPKNVTNIGNAVFYRCSNLTDVYCYAENVPETGINVFIDSPIESATLHVPAGSVDKYKATEPWSGFGNIVPIAYFPEGTKWTEIRLDTLKYDSWYSKVGDEWVPNFETIEYYVKGEYVEKGRDDDHTFKKVYTSGPEWSDSLTLLISESQWGIEVSVAIFNEDGVPFYPGRAYMFDDWREGYMLSYQTIDGANIPSLPAVGIKDYGTITEIKEGYFGGEKLLKYVDLNGIRIIHGIGVTEWNDGECIFGPVDPYSCYYGTYPGMPKNRDYRSMLVHFERNGEVLYDVWPAKESVSFTKNQMATIILPTTPDASKGKYYRLDRCEEGKIIFTEEREPKARTPYIIVPNEDFSIDLDKLELESLLSDTVSVKGAMFVGSYNSAEMNCQEGFYIDIIDTTPDCQIIGTDQRKAAIGALRAYLVAPWDDPYAQGGSRGVTVKREIVLKDNPNDIESIHNS